MVEKKSLHDFVKENYENGAYHRNDYPGQPPNYGDDHPDHLSDYERGWRRYHQDQSKG